MCIIAVQPRGISIDDATINRMWDKNRDGAGYAFVSDDGVITIRKFMDKEQFLAQWKKDQESYNFYSPFILHFRIKTHGKVKSSNNHPFLVHPDLCFAHNGIIKIDIPVRYVNRGWSDTRYFCRHILKNLTPSFFRDETLKTLVESYIGESKLAFLNSDGETFIFNEKKGTWDDKIWYSNSGYKDYTADYKPFPHSGGTYWEKQQVKKAEEEAAKKAAEQRDPASGVGFCGTGLAPSAVAEKKSDILQKNADGTWSEKGTVVPSETATSTSVVPYVKAEVVPIIPKRIVRLYGVIHWVDPKKLIVAVEQLTFLRLTCSDIYDPMLEEYYALTGADETAVWDDPHGIMDITAFYDDKYAHLEEAIG